MAQRVLLSDPRIAATPVKECDEPLVDLREEKVVRVDPRLADAAGAYAYVRLGVADRLTTAQARLPRGLRLLLVEGYRPYTLQEHYFAGCLARMRARNPLWSPERAWREAAKYVSPPEVAPHVAGGAVDVTVCDADGAELPMGTEVNATPPEYGKECYTDAAGISERARSNRQVLIAAMTAAGFVNYPTEWWHWSYPGVKAVSGSRASARPAAPASSGWVTTWRPAMPVAPVTRMSRLVASVAWVNRRVAR